MKDISSPSNHLGINGLAWSQTTDRPLTGMLLPSAKKASGLKIRAGQWTMSGQDNHLSGQTVSPQVRESRFRNPGTFCFCGIRNPALWDSNYLNKSSL